MCQDRKPARGGAHGRTGLGTHSGAPAPAPGRAAAQGLPRRRGHTAGRRAPGGPHQHPPRPRSTAPSQGRRPRSSSFPGQVAQPRPAPAPPARPAHHPGPATASAASAAPRRAAPPAAAAREDPGLAGGDRPDPRSRPWMTGRGTARPAPGRRQQRWPAVDRHRPSRRPRQDPRPTAQAWSEPDARARRGPLLELAKQADPRTGPCRRTRRSSATLWPRRESTKLLLACSAGAERMTAATSGSTTTWDASWRWSLIGRGPEEGDRRPHSGPRPLPGDRPRSWQPPGGPRPRCRGDRGVPGPGSAPRFCNDE